MLTVNAFVPYNSIREALSINIAGWHSTYQYSCIVVWYVESKYTVFKAYLAQTVKHDSIRVVLDCFCGRCGCPCFLATKAKHTTSCLAGSCCRSESTSTRWVSCAQLFVWVHARKPSCPLVVRTGMNSLPACILGNLILSNSYGRWTSTCWVSCGQLFVWVHARKLSCPLVIRTGIDSLPACTLGDLIFFSNS